MRVVSGIQPTGKLHLGNYFAAVRQFIAYQSPSNTPLFFIADLHALTSIHDGARLERLTADIALDFLALGLHPERSVIFRQSAIPEIPLFTWALGTIAPVALLQRGHSYKSVPFTKGASLALLAYPVLMAADLLLYQAELAPVGHDQMQHLEVARTLARRFNTAYGMIGPRALRAPRADAALGVTLVPGIDGQKMSKSYNNTIDLFAADDDIRRRIKAIRTDSSAIASPKPEPSPLLSLLRLLASNDEFTDIYTSWQRGGVSYAAYKDHLTQLFFAHFGEARERRRQLAHSAQPIAEILRQGAARARHFAEPTWSEVCRVTGLPNGCTRGSTSSC